MSLFPLFIYWLIAPASSQHLAPSSKIQLGENVFGAILFFSYILAALYFTSYIVRSISRIQTQNQPTSNPKSKLNHGRPSYSNHDRSRGADEARRQQALLTFSALALASFATLSWNMLNFLIVSHLTWSSTLGTDPVLRLDSLYHIKHDLYRIWIWATGSNLFQSFAEDLLSEPAKWRTVQAALIYSYTWNAWMSALGLAANVPDSWAYFVLDQILPVSFTQNLFCVALTRTGAVPLDTKRAGPDRIPVSCMRLIGLLCYLLTLYWIPSTVGTDQFIPTLFLLRILLLTPYFIDWLAYHWRSSSSQNLGFRTETFNKGLAAVSSIVVIHASIQGGVESKVYEGLSIATPEPNYAAAALSNDMVLGLVGGAAFFFLLRRT